MKNTGIKRLLIIGIGNSGRRDDGLGWALLDELQEILPYAATFEYRYQLQIEDAALIADYEQVLFVDATVDRHENGYRWTELQPKAGTSYTSHALPPAQVLFLCQELYKEYPDCYLLAITGQEWGLQLGLSDTAHIHLERAKEATIRELEARSGALA